MLKYLVIFIGASICALIVDYKYPEFYWPSCAVFIAGVITGKISSWFCRRNCYVDSIC